MIALVKNVKGNGNMEIRDVPDPKPGPGQVKIEIMGTGVCGSDLHIYHDDIPGIPLRPPVVTGHEFSGTVIDIGDEVTDWKRGDRVVSETAFSYCGKCEYCMTGFYNLCNERRTLGYWYDGAFASYTVVPQEKLHKIPGKIDFLSGALIEPLACITHAVLELTEITVGDIVLVSGPGAIGLMSLQVAKAQGAKVIVSGTSIDGERLDMAKRLGADYVIDVEKDNLQEFVKDITQGKGTDVVLECSGAAKAADEALKAIKKRGSYTQIGLFGKPINIDFEKICYKEIRVTGSLGSKWTSWEKAFSMFEKKEGIKLVLLPV